MRGRGGGGGNLEGTEFFLILSGVDFFLSSFCILWFWAFFPLPSGHFPFSFSSLFINIPTHTFKTRKDLGGYRLLGLPEISWSKERIAARV